MEEELKAVKNYLTRVADTLERIESSRSGPGMSNFFEWFEHLYFSDEYDLIYNCFYKFWRFFWRMAVIKDSNPSWVL